MNFHIHIVWVLHNRGPATPMGVGPSRGASGGSVVPPEATGDACEAASDSEDEVGDGECAVAARARWRALWVSGTRRRSRPGGRWCAEAPHVCGSGRGRAALTGRRNGGCACGSAGRAGCPPHWR